MRAVIYSRYSSDQQRAAGGPELLAEQIKVVAGAGFEPAAFRL
jgi:hypothetical protein